jgi:hypothetical protein
MAKSQKPQPFPVGSKVKVKFGGPEMDVVEVLKKDQRRCLHLTETAIIRDITLPVEVLVQAEGLPGRN